MTNPVDTIREALLNRPHSQTQPWNEAMAALTEVEQQLAAYQLEFDETGKCLRLCTPEAQARLEAAEQRSNDLADALRQIKSGNLRAYGHPVEIARAALDRHTQPATDEQIDRSFDAYR